MATVSIEQAKQQVDALFARVEAGEQIIVEDAGVGKIMLVPMGDAERRGAGRFRGQFTVPDSFFDPITDDELKDWGF